LGSPSGCGAADRRLLFFCEDEVAVTGNAKIKAGALRELAAKRLAGN
jgi:fatty-acyl-CoA synthase